MNAQRPNSPNPMFIQWVILGLALVALGAVIWGNRYQEKVNIEARERDRLLFQTRIVEQIIDTNLVALNSVLGHLSKDWSLGDSHRDTNHRLETLDEALTGVRTLLVLDGQGRSRAANRPELLGLDLSQRDYFQTVRDNPDPDTLYLSPPYRTVLGVFSMNVSRMVQGPDGGFAGVVVATLDPEFFIPLLNSVLYSPDMRAAIIHGDGRLFLMVPERQDVAGMNLAQPESFFSRHRDSGQDVNVFTGRVFATGEERMLAVRTIRPAGLKMDKSMAVVIGRDPFGIYENWRKDTAFHGGLFVPTILGSSLVLLLFQRRQRAYDREMAEAAGALAESERFMRLVTGNIPGMVGYWNTELRCVYANNAYLEWFGRTPEQMVGVSMPELMGQALFSANEPFIRAALRGEPQRFERAMVKADGGTGHALVRYIPDHDGDRVRGFFVLASDVTELKATQRELERRVLELDILAATDALTGIGNRRHFLERAKEELGRSGRYGLPLVFLMLDIDHFKAVNDAHGHDAGDAVLKALAAILRDTVRATDLIGRLGGEEFGAVLIQTDCEEARHVAERLRQALEDAAMGTAGGPVRVTVSIGLAAFTGPGDHVEAIMKRADLALFNAKRTGRNRVRCFGEF